MRSGIIRCELDGKSSANADRNPACSCKGAANSISNCAGVQPVHSTTLCRHRWWPVAVAGSGRPWRVAAANGRRQLARRGDYAYGEGGSGHCRALELFGPRRPAGLLDWIFDVRDDLRPIESRLVFIQHGGDAQRQQLATAIETRASKEGVDVTPVLLGDPALWYDLDRNALEIQRKSG